MTQTESTRELVLHAHHALFTRRDVSALDRYFSPQFIEHSPLVADGLTGLRDLVQTHPELEHETCRVLQDGNLVALHGRFTGLEAQPLVGFDLYRVAQGKIVEHWDGLVPQAAANVSGRSQLDGPVITGPNDHREKNRELITAFFNRVLIQGDYAAFSDYTDGNCFLQHSPDIADGVEAVIDFLETMKKNGHALVYKKNHHIVADGQFVLTHSEGRIGAIRHAYFELWRISNGKIAELWDAITPVPEDKEAAHSYGIF